MKVTLRTKMTMDLDEIEIIKACGICDGDFDALIRQKIIYGLNGFEVLEDGFETNAEEIADILLPLILNKLNYYTVFRRKYK